MSHGTRYLKTLPPAPTAGMATRFALFHVVSFLCLWSLFITTPGCIRQYNDFVGRAEKEHDGQETWAPDWWVDDRVGRDGPMPDVCSPDCTGNECGDDGCGGSCGACGEGTQCHLGACAYPYRDDTDTMSYLAWQNPAAPDTMSWDLAKQYCKALNLGPDLDSEWRLPTVDELRSLIRGCKATESGGTCKAGKGCQEKSCMCEGCGDYDGDGEEGMYWPEEIAGGCCWYWTSELVEGDEELAWYVDFASGRVNYCSVLKEIRVRCVREAR